MLFSLSCHFLIIIINVKTFNLLAHTFVLDKNSYSVQSIHLKFGQHWEFLEVVQAGIKMFKTCLSRKSKCWKQQYFHMQQLHQLKAAKQNNNNKFTSMSGYLIHQKSIKPIQLLVSGETEYSERKNNNIGNSYSTPSFSF